MTSTTAYLCSRVFDGEKIHANAALLVEDGKVAGLLSADQVPVGVETVDLGDGILAPGLIDLHGHYDEAAMLMAVDPDLTALPNGVTTGVDAGSVGFANYRGLEMVMERSVVDVYSFLHIGAVGLSLLVVGF